MAHEGQEVLIKDALVFLFAAGVLVPVLRAFKLPTVVGFILAGVALGPMGVSAFSDQLPLLEYFTLSDPAAAAPFAELGVLFLLFLLGLELSFKKLWALRRVVFGAGSMQALLSAFAIGYVAYSFGLAPPAAALVGLALALSSTAIVMQLMIEHKRAATPVGRTALGILLLQDILVAPILIYAGFVTLQVDSGLTGVLIDALWQGLTALAIIFLIGRYLLRHIFRLAANSGGRDFLMAITLLTVVGASVVTASAGLSIALGAFLAGLLLGETEFKHQTEVDLEPFKGLLLGLFFITVGLGLDISYVVSRWEIVIGGVLALIICKAIIASLSARIFAGGWPLSLEAAFLLAPGGEFAFVIIGAGVASGAIGPEPATLVAAIAGLSMLLTTSSWHFGRWLGDMVSNNDVEAVSPADYADLDGHIVIAGFGRVGRSIAEVMLHQEADLVAVESDASAVARHRRAGWKVYFGDGSRPEVLAKVGLANAAILIITLDNPDRAEALVMSARLQRPDLPILVRARDAEHARQLYKAGASFVIPDAVEAGLQMSIRALEEVGYDSETARDLIASEREAAYEKATQT
ncbi:MAG: cation:proton antiporter [Henriciella sp.]